MRDLAKALEVAVPLYSGDPVFDASHVILTSYPDLLVDETGKTCEAGGSEDGTEDTYPSNQSMDAFSAWLATTTGRLNSVHEQLSALHSRMKELAGDQGWTFAGRVYEDKVFTRHGFCAQSSKFVIRPCRGPDDSLLGPGRTGHADLPVELVRQDQGMAALQPG